MVIGGKWHAWAAAAALPALCLWGCAGGDSNGLAGDVPGLTNSTAGANATAGVSTNAGASAGTITTAGTAATAGTSAGLQAPPPAAGTTAGAQVAGDLAPPPAGDGAPPPIAGDMAGEGAAGQAPPPPPPPGDLCLQAGSGDYAGAGPYQVGMMDVQIASAPTPGFTVFYPMPLEAACPHPITAWGNGTGVEGSGTYAHYGRNVASWGIVMIAAHDSNVGSGEWHKAGLDWLLAQNEDPSSMFYQKLSPRAGVSGHSQGGIGATAASNHPNVQAEVCVQGGGIPAANVAFICLTGTDDFVRGPCVSAYSAASGPSFLADHSMADHIGTPTPLGVTTDAGRQYIRLMSAWFRCYLADDPAACAVTAGGASSQVCADPGWATCEGSGL